MTAAQMRLTVVGCSGSYPGPRSPCSCYLVEAEEDGRTWRVLLDLGSGALGRLHDFVDPLAIDAVFLSHLHPDHWFDMSGYYVMRKYHPSGAQPRIPVYGPRGTAKRMAKGYGLPEKPGMTQEFMFREYADHAPVTVGPLTIEVALVDHPVDAYALKVGCNGRTFVYSGDTGPTPTLVDLARGSELLLAEAAFREGEENPQGLHLTGKEAAEAAARAGVPRLVLTHIPPWHDPEDARSEAEPVFGGVLEVAHSGATYDI